MSYSPYAAVNAAPAAQGQDIPERDLQPGELDQMVKSYPMVTLLIKPIIQKRDMDFHTDDEFDDENLQTLIHFINGKYHHGLGESAGSEMIQLAFKRYSKNVPNWDKFLTDILAGVYGSRRENIDRIADSLDD